MPESVDVMDAVAFLYDASMPCKVLNRRKVLLDDEDWIYIFDEEEGADDNVSRSVIRVEMTERGAKTCYGCMFLVLDRCHD